MRYLELLSEIQEERNAMKANRLQKWKEDSIFKDLKAISFEINQPVSPRQEEVPMEIEEQHRNISKLLYTSSKQNNTTEISILADDMLKFGEFNKEKLEFDLPIKDYFERVDEITDDLECMIKDNRKINFPQILAQLQNNFYHEHSSTSI